jgi:hypothetical protein
MMLVSNSLLVSVFVVRLRVWLFVHAARSGAARCGVCLRVTPQQCFASAAAA